MVVTQISILITREDHSRQNGPNTSKLFKINFTTNQPANHLLNENHTPQNIVEILHRQQKNKKIHFLQSIEINKNKNILYFFNEQTETNSSPLLILNIQLYYKNPLQLLLRSLNVVHQMYILLGKTFVQIQIEPEFLSNNFSFVDQKYTTLQTYLSWKK